MKPLINSSVKKYDNNIYSSGIVKFTDYIIEKYDKVHSQLYENALNKFIAKQAKLENISEAKYKSRHTIIEEKADEYYLPSNILVISKKRPYKKEVYSLKEYWDNTYYNESKHTTKDILDTGDEPIGNFKIIDINYVRGFVILESKITGKRIETSAENITDDYLLGEELILKNTFSR